MTHARFARAALAIAITVVATAAGAQATPATTDDATASGPIRVLLAPERETTLVSQMVGRVDRLGGEIGASFKQGATLVSMDCSENEAKVRMAEAEYNSARENHEAKLRLQGLQAAGEVEVSMAAAAAAKAKAAIELGKTQVRLCRIAAPFPGRIVKLHVKEFQGINVGQPVMDIVSAGPLKVRLNAPSKWLSWLKVGTPFDVLVDETGKTYRANVRAINGRVDAVSQSIEIEGRVDGSPAELLAGMSGNARFTRPQK